MCELTATKVCDPFLSQELQEEVFPWDGKAYWTEADFWSRELVASSPGIPPPETFIPAHHVEQLRALIPPTIGEYRLEVTFDRMWTICYRNGDYILDDLTITTSFEPDAYGQMLLHLLKTKHKKPEDFYD